MRIKAAENSDFPETAASVASAVDYSATARNLVRSDNFVEVHVSTTLAICEQRDIKGLYKKARSGQLPNMTGIDSRYEAPDNPDVILDCGQKPVAEAVRELLGVLGA